MISGRCIFFLPPPPLCPSFALAPTLRVTIFTLLIFLRHNRDGGYNSTNKQLSPAQNTPALQARLTADQGYSVFQPENSAWGQSGPYNPFLGARYFKKGPMYQYLSNMQKRRNSWKVKEMKMAVYLKLTWSIPLYTQ